MFDATVSIVAAVRIPDVYFLPSLFAFVINVAGFNQVLLYQFETDRT